MPPQRKRVILVAALAVGTTIPAWATNPAPARLFYADANVSVTLPDRWDLNTAFPAGPMFSRNEAGGAQALMTCVLSDPIDPHHLTGDLPPEALHKAVDADLTARAPQGKVLSRHDRSIGGHAGYELTWENPEEDRTYEYASVYFFFRHRIYTLTMRAPADRYADLIADFENWVGSLQILARTTGGALLEPAHGGIWVHVAGGARVAIPGDWLIGIADDQHMGATLVQADQHTEVTATVDTALTGATALTEEERAMDRHALVSEGFRILHESDEPFHGLPAYALAYDGKRGARFVKGQDLWVASSRGRWLFNIEGDGPLFNKRTNDYRDIMNQVQFL